MHHKIFKVVQSPVKCRAVVATPLFTSAARASSRHRQHSIVVMDFDCYTGVARRGFKKSFADLSKFWFSRVDESALGVACEVGFVVFQCYKRYISSKRFDFVIYSEVLGLQ